MPRFIKSLSRLVQRLPFTLAMLTGIIAMGLATGTPTHHLDPVLRQRWGFAFADFWHGTWCALLTAVFMTDRPLMSWGILPFTGCSVGVYEWLAGTRRAAWLYGLTDLGGKLGLVPMALKKSLTADQDMIVSYGMDHRL